jgi:hypothetical protein
MSGNRRAPVDVTAVHANTFDNEIKFAEMSELAADAVLRSRLMFVNIGGDDIPTMPIN